MAQFWSCWLIVVLLCGTAWCGDHPALTPENEVPLQPTIWLPDGKVTSVRLPKERVRRLYFTLKKRSSLLSVTVSPCDASIEWSINARTIKDKSFQSIHWTSKKSVPEVWWRGSGKDTKLYSFTGNTRDTYTGYPHPSASIYIIKLKSKEEDTRVLVYLQEGDMMQGPFPKVPADPHVHTIGVGLTSVTLSWMPSDSVLHLPPESHTNFYCVSVNRKQNYQSLCAAREATKSEMEKRWKESVHSLDKESSWQTWDSFRKVERSPMMLGNALDLDCACKGVEAVCTISDLLPDTQYYFDVFVIDMVNNTSSAYAGTSARTHEEARQHGTPWREGEVRWVTLQASSGQAQVFSFRPRGWQQSALLTLQRCNTEEMKVSVSNKGQILTSQVAGKGIVQMWLQGKPSYQVVLEDMTSTKGTSTSMVKMQISSAYHRRTAPSLPATLQIKSFNKLRTCNSVTLAWLGTEERSLYCVYRRRLGDGEQAKNEPCLGPESRSNRERILCKYFQELNPRKAVTTATIGGLESGAAYQFDVYLMRRWGIPVKYNSKTVRTRKEC